MPQRMLTGVYVFVFVQMAAAWVFAAEAAESTDDR